MNTKNNRIIICLLIFFLLCSSKTTYGLLISSQAPSDDFLIQQLINNAQPFDHIIIPNGTFQEHLSINKPITLIGSGHTIIDGMYQDSVLTIQSSDVHILNISFMNSGGDTSDSGISAQGINITIEHCDFIFSKQGIQFNNTEQSSILNCSFHQLGKGMALLNSTNISIKSSMVSRCGIGSFLHSSSNVYLNTSTFQTNGLSVYASECNNLIMNRVIIQDTSDNHGGLFVQDSSIITINQSKIHHNGIGINIDQSDHVIISTCEITNNTHFGVLLRTHADHITIKNCLIKNNLRYGIYCFEKTSAIVMRNIITDNYLFGLYSKNPVFVLDENWWDSPMGPTMLPFHSGERLSLNNFIFHFGQWNTSSFTLRLQDLIPKHQYQQFISKNISIFLEGIDSDGDGAPDWWEEKWGYQTESKDNHYRLDEDEDGLSNLEECFTDQWGSSPSRKDIFLEIDWMATQNSHMTNKPSPRVLERMVDSFAANNISLHIDDGCLGGGGEIPNKPIDDFNAMIEVYWDFFLDKDITNPRKGIFHYVIIADECADVSYPFIGWDSFDSIAVSSELAKQGSPLHSRQMIIAGGIMHQLGSTLGLTVETHQGNDNWLAGSIGSIEWMKYHQYKSSMNYLYKYQLLTYSDGSNGPYDFDDWDNLDLGFFKQTSFDQ